MNTNYRKDPLQEEIEKNTGTFNLIVTVKKDLEMTNMFKHIPNFIAFKTIIKNENGELVGVGSATSVLNKYNKWLDRTVLFAKNASLVDAMVRSTKVIDALSIMPTNQKENEIDLEGRDKTTFFNDEDLPQLATDKQKNFLSKLIEKCDEEMKEEYQSQLASPYLSKFECSELINSLLPVK